MIVGITVSEFRSGVPVSVYKDSWSKEFANAGISSNAFYQNYQTIRSYLGEAPDSKDTGILYLRIQIVKPTMVEDNKQIDSYPSSTKSRT